MAALTAVAPHGVPNVEDAPTTLWVALPRARYALTWVFVLTTCGLNGFIALGLVAIYYVGHTIRRGYLLEATGLLPLKAIPFVIACYAVVVVYFWSHVIALLWVSVRHRRLAFPAPSQYHWKRSCRLSHIFFALWSRLSTLLCPLMPSANAFEVRFLLREMIEIALQTFQAYKCSLLVSQRSINTFYVAVLAINCWAAPAVYLTTHRWPALQRFRYIWSDLMLDFVSAFVVPVRTVYSMILVALVDNFNRASGAENAFDVPYDDVFLMNTIKAAQQIGVTSWLDLVSKLMPFYSMATCVRHIERLVVPASLGTTEAVELEVPAKPLTRQRRSKSFHRSLLSLRIVHALFVAWGAVVLALHIHADCVSLRAPVEHKLGCKSSSQPWFVNQFSCTVLEINCYRRGISGTADEIDAALASVSPQGVSSLIIAHCPSLSIPPRLQHLGNLVGLEIANSTLVDWGERAELLGINHKSLQFLTLARINMTELPLALQSSHFPTSLTNINLAATNLSSLPDDLDTKWRRLLNLFIERSQFTAIPPSVARMRPDRFSMMYNRLTEIPDDLLANNRYLALSIAHNPVKKWPKNVGSVDELTTVVMDFTLLDELPSWLLGEGQRRAEKSAPSIVVSAGGSTYCDKLSTAGTSPSRTVDSSQQLLSPVGIMENIEWADFRFQILVEANLPYDTTSRCAWIQRIAVNLFVMIESSKYGQRVALADHSADHLIEIETLGGWYVEARTSLGLVLAVKLRSMGLHHSHASSGVVCVTRNFYCEDRC